MDETNYDGPTMTLHLTLDEIEAIPWCIDRSRQNLPVELGRHPQAPHVILNYEQVGIINRIIRKTRQLPDEAPHTYMATALGRRTETSATNTRITWSKFYRNEIAMYRLFTFQRQANTSYSGTIRLRGPLATSLRYIDMHHATTDNPTRPIKYTKSFMKLWMGLLLRIHCAVNITHSTTAVDILHTNTTARLAVYYHLEDI